MYVVAVPGVLSYLLLAGHWQGWVGELSGVVVHAVQVGEGTAVEVMVVVVRTPVVDVGGQAP